MTAAEALLIVDVQRVLVEGEHAIPGADDLVERLTSALARARAAGVPVVHLQDNGVHDRLIRRGSHGWKLALRLEPGEPVIAKNEDDGFAGTGLAELLSGSGVTRVVVAGIQSEMCVAATARGAIAEGLHVVLPRDGHLTHDIPDEGPVAPGVPANLVSRVAEWSLGDEVETPDTLAEVTFVPPTRRHQDRGDGYTSLMTSGTEGAR